jgi:uncharacterized phage-associated protein
MKLQEQKRIQAIIFFAYKSTDNKINRLKLMKLLWLADRIHLNLYGRTILNDVYCALPHGPVPSKTMDLSERSIDNLYKVDDYTIEAEDKSDLRYFSKSDIEVLEEVWNRYGDRSDKVLRDYSHLFPEWKRFEEELNDTTHSNSYRMVIDDFFKEPSEVKDFKIDTEMSELSRTIYYENNKIHELLTQ